MLNKFQGKFGEEYTETADNGLTDKKVSKAIGLNLDELYELVSILYSDLDVKKYGIGWWTAYKEFGTKRRIIVGDYLYMSVKSIEMNCIDARLHLLEAEEAWKYENEILKKHIEKNNNNFIGVPERNSLNDDLGRLLIELNVVGFVRAVGSVLDCLSAAIIGVLGLPQRIDKASYRGVFHYLKASKNEVEVNFLKEMEKSINKSGPAEWIEWAINLRNMYVHKPRRLRFSKVDIQRSKITDSQGVNFVKDSKLVGLLAKRPDEWDVETWIGGGFDGLLREDAKITLFGVMESVQILVADISKLLVDIWNRRKHNPMWIKQSIEQWDFDRAKDKGLFKGYAPKEMILDVQALVTNRELGRRFMSASADDKNRGNWNKFD